MLKDLYKKQSHDLVERQEERRQRLLKEQKEKRQELLDKARESYPTEEDYPRKPHCKFKSFKDLYESEWSLQLSEWMREKPEDLTEWLLMPCPRGQRCMVVAHNGYTTVFSKTGRRCFGFRSILPGDRSLCHQLTVLDCIYVKALDVFYVLDALSYGSQELIECDAKFRFFWLNSKFSENPDLSQSSELNEKAFHLVEHYDFENWESIIEALQKYPLWPDNNPPLDGFLFYHKDANYICGTTPLVCWLFPFMVYDVLNLLTSPQYEKPLDYITPLQYMDLFDSQQDKKIKVKRKTPADYAMEAEPSESLVEVLEQQKHLEMDDMLQENLSPKLDFH